MGKVIPITIYTIAMIFLLAGAYMAVMHLTINYVGGGELANRTFNYMTDWLPTLNFGEFSLIGTGGVYIILALALILIAIILSKMGYDYD